MTEAFVVGYDPGGDRAHGVAAMRVKQTGTRWTPTALVTATVDSLEDATAWVQQQCSSGRIVATGIDTLTEWSAGPGGWRPADLWLRQRYPEVARSVVAPNSMYGAMAMNGATFLTLLGPRLRDDGAVVTEAHPKVTYFALTGQRSMWKANAAEMTRWLFGELRLDPPAGSRERADHAFDATMAALAALRGLNREWTRDLHALPHDGGKSVRFYGTTHYWWPDHSR